MRESPRFEALPLGLLLALAGGSLDCYTYLNRGQVFATAETGNLVMMGARLAQGQWAQALHYLPPILAFAAGVLATELLRTALEQRKPPFDWRKCILLLECAVVASVALLPLGRWDLLANGLISFTSAMQVESFRVIAGCGCATTMCTGNLRAGTEHLLRRLARKDRAAGQKAATYYALILSFVAGAVLSGCLSPLLGQYTALLPCLLLLAAVILS
ncbi:MAG: DUF1275 domain-containing protein [Ruminiclostridium sp.]|nr:DUF1275 domain-containing protein [Ruminiclostridium sp.]